MRGELWGRGSNEQDINDITRGQVSYLILLASLTALITGAVYLLLPYLTNMAINPLGELPIPHILIGFLVVTFIAATLVMYLRSNSEDN